VQKNAVLLRAYGISLEEYNALLLVQGGVCAICRSATKGTKSGKALFVDHCHITGKVRGLLCNACNTVLGKMQDSVERLQSAIVYLQKDSAQ